MTANQQRFPEIDFFRGLSVVAMILYHLFWDLVYFDLVPWGLLGEDPVLIAKAIGASFQLIAGVSLSISYARTVERAGTQGVWRKYVLRGLKLLAWATGVGLVVYFTVDMPIFFGILHLLGTAIMVSPLFLPRPQLAAVVGLVIIASARWLARLPVSAWWLVPLGVGEADIPMADYYPLVPWLGVVLVGIWLGTVLYPGGRRRSQLDLLARLTSLQGAAWIRFCGRHSLLIYLIHQPLIFALVYGLYSLLAH